MKVNMGVGNSKLHDVEESSQHVLDAIEATSGFLSAIQHHNRPQDHTVPTFMKRQHCDDHMEWWSCESKRMAKRGEDMIANWKHAMITELSAFVARINNDDRGLVTSTSTVSPPKAVVWRRSGRGWIKLNTFGLSQKESGSDVTKMCIGGSIAKAVCGGVIRDSEGEVILSFVKQVGLVDNHKARCLGLFHEVMELYSLPFEVKKVWIECDCKKIAKSVHLNRKEGEPIHRMLKDLEEWHISCVNDDGNKLACGMTVWGMSLSEDLSIANDVFPLLRWMVEDDIKREIRCFGSRFLF